MVNKNKNTVINNKNIIQICCDKPMEKQQQDNGKKQKPINYLKDNAMESQPFNLVNSFPNSTGLEDRRARFVDAMRDPTSTKSPYSIFDNGSNTFAREGNTVGAEQPVQPVISQADYFQQPRTLIRPPRLPQRIPVSEPPFSAGSPINRYYDELDDDDDATQASSIYQNAWERQEQPEDEFNNQDDDIYAYNAEELEGPQNVGGIASSTEIGPESVVNSYEDEGQEDTYSNLDLTTGPTRFSETQQQTAPFMRSPYRMPEETEVETEVIPFRMPEETKAQQTQEEEALTEQQADNALREAERRVEEDNKRREGMSRQRQQLAEELQRQKEIDGKYKSVKKNLEEFIKTTTDALTIKGKTSQPAQVKKTSELKKQILGLLKDPEFIEYEGKKNIGNLRNANKLLQLITDGSKTVEQRIKDIEGDKKEDIKRVIPKTRGNIQTFKPAGEVRAGGAARIANMV